MTFSVTILGSNSALPTSERHPTAQILNVSERFFLIDCGEGTQMQLRKYRVKFSKIHHIFISHLHGDHVFGLIGLISSLGLLGRKKDLHIYSHPDLEKLLTPHLKYFCKDLPYQIVFNPIDAKKQEVIYEDKKVIVSTIPLKHRIATSGFLFVEKQDLPNIRKECIQRFDLSIAEIVKIKNGSDLKLESGKIVFNEELIIPAALPRSYAYCSDTKYSPNLASMVKGVSVLYHESTFLNSDKEIAKKTTHSTAVEAAKVAKEAGVKKLVLGHFSSRYKQLESFIEEAKTVFEDTILGIEGTVLDITEDKD